MNEKKKLNENKENINVGRHVAGNRVYEIKE